MTGRGPIAGLSMRAASSGAKTALLDGEMVVQDEFGLSDFHALRSAIYTAPHRIVFSAFDLLHLNGQDLRGHPPHGESRASQEAGQGRMRLR